MTTALQLSQEVASRASTEPPRRYPLDEAFFKAALNGAMQESLFSPVTLGERHDVRLKPGFDTACWAYLPPHQIYVGTDLFEKRLVKSGLSTAQQEKYIGNHYHHELGHALFTERDMSRIQTQLKALSAPFQLYNLFEDAVMEQRYRTEAAYRFGWLDLEDMDFNARPESLLFALIQAEGHVETVETALNRWEPRKPNAIDTPFVALTMLLAPVAEDARANLQALLPKVVVYYQRIVAVSQSMRLIPILRDWLQEFGRPPEMPEAGMADMKLSVRLMTNPEAAKDFAEGTISLMANEGASVKEGPAKRGKPNSADAAIACQGSLLQSRAQPVDTLRAERLAQKFRKLFKSETRYIATEAPQKRISAKHLALGLPFYRRKETYATQAKNIFLEVDCSGSMRGQHMAEGKLLVSALSLLARQGFVKGHVVLSGIVNHQSRWELFALPMAQSKIDMMEGFASAEGLESTLRQNLQYAKKADYVFVYTDGQICDKPIDKKFLHQQGIYTWGLYVGDNQEYLNELTAYFDKAILRQSVEDLIDTMLAQLK